MQITALPPELRGVAVILDVRLSWKEGAVRVQGRVEFHDVRDSPAPPPREPAP